MDIRNITESDIEESFVALTSYLDQFNPIKLVTQLSMTFTMIPEGTFVEDTDERIKWTRIVEFMAGYYLSQELPETRDTLIDGRVMEKLGELFDDYSNKLIFYTMLSCRNYNQLIANVRGHSSMVRGDSYPHVLIMFAKELYSEHDDWFRDNLGFTISEAIDLMLTVKSIVEEKVNGIKPFSRKTGKDYAERMISEGRIKESDREEVETIAAIYVAFSSSDMLFSFSHDELVKASGLDKTIVESFVSRLSQEFGYTNSFFGETFVDPLKALWDYNTLYEKPFVKDGDRYKVPLLSVFPSILFNTFHYDLLSDKSYEDKYNKDRGSWVEEKTAECLKKVFPENEVFMNPDYPDGNEFCDVLVLHDRKIFIVQCKSKRLRRESETGDSFDALKDDLGKSVVAAFEQGKKCRDYLKSDKTPSIVINGNSLSIDMTQATDIFIVTVTLGQYQDLFSRMSILTDLFESFENGDYPWALSLFDLLVVTEIVDNPAMLVHFLSRRRKLLANTDKIVFADEIDLLAYYLDWGLLFESEEYEKMKVMGIAGYSQNIDKYIYEKYECGKDVEKPKQSMSEEFEGYYKSIDSLDIPYKTDCLLIILDLGDEGRQQFVDHIERCKNLTIEDRKGHSISAVLSGHETGYVFISNDDCGDISKLQEEVANLCFYKMDQTDVDKWAGFGWDVNSTNLIDTCFFVQIQRVAEENK